MVACAAAGEGKFHDGAAAEEGSAVKEREETSMQTTIMLLFYGFLAGILVMCAGFSTRKRASRRVAETISAAGGTLSACCFLMILGCGYLSTLL